MKNNILAKKLIKQLIKKKTTISTTESCTGGLISSLLTSIPGSSKAFDLGIIVYSNRAKIENLKVSKKTIKKFGAVSLETCVSMVKNLNKISQSEINVAVTGIAGPDGGTKKKPVGLVYIGIKKNNKISVTKYLFKNKGRTYIQKTAANKSLGLVLRLFK